MVKVIGSLGGKKFVMAVFGVVAVVLAAKFGISEETTYKIAAMVCSFVLGQGVADGLSGGATSSNPPAPKE